MYFLVATKRVRGMRLLGPAWKAAKARGTAPVSVHAGQVLDGVWRLEPVTGGMLNFTYLPLNQTRSLRTGD